MNMQKWTDDELAKYDRFKLEAGRGESRCEPLLLQAMRLRETTIFLMLLDHFWEPNERFGNRNYTILMHCVENYGGSLCMQYLMQAGLKCGRPLEKRVDMSLVGIDGDTALRIATRKGNIPYVSLLLGAKSLAPVDIKNKYSQTPFDIATDRSKGEQAERFIVIKDMLCEYTRKHIKSDKQVVI